MNYSEIPGKVSLSFWVRLWRTHSCVPRSHSCERMLLGALLGQQAIVTSVAGTAAEWAQ
jgi:hypothetical protein